jgi:REP element-mobilizing transposase RayT
MTRLARMIVPRLPHHVTQRGNRREAIFIEDGDKKIYCDMLAERFRKSGIFADRWSWHFAIRRHQKCQLHPSTKP